MELKLNNEDDDLKTFYLYDDGKKVSSYDVEYCRGGGRVIISMATDPSYRKRGYATNGLILLKEKLFKEGVCIIEGINLSGDISKMAFESAGFFPRTIESIDSYVILNPDADSIADDRIIMSRDNPAQKRKEELLKGEISFLRRREVDFRRLVTERLGSLKTFIDIEKDADSNTIVEYNHLRKISSLYGSGDLTQKNIHL